MKVFSLVLALVGVAALTTAADTGFLDRSIRLAGGTYKYQVYVPAEWAKRQT